MTYFRQLPNIQYENFLDTSTGSQDFLTTKNIFLRAKLRDDLQNNFTVFNKYVIMGDERPDQIAYKLYGTSEYDWVVLTTANIINYQNEFPFTSQQLWEYVTNKYGETGANDIKYYETKEVKDDSGRLILPAGVIVDENFTIPDPDFPTSFINPVLGISNWDYEGRINDDKRTIYVLRPSYLNIFLNDIRGISKYGVNSQFIDPNTIKGFNSKIASP